MVWLTRTFVKRSICLATNFVLCLQISMPISLLIHFATTNKKNEKKNALHFYLCGLINGNGKFFWYFYFTENRVCQHEPISWQHLTHFFKLLRIVTCHSFQQGSSIFFTNSSKKALGIIATKNLKNIKFQNTGPKWNLFVQKSFWCVQSTLNSYA